MNLEMFFDCHLYIDGCVSSQKRPFQVSSYKCFEGLLRHFACTMYASSFKALLPPQFNAVAMQPFKIFTFY